ncbi:hypothetical protein BJY01DRAFT_250351 [Aspergillus pseudoustus]|uniref:Carrier domain-containing protein n=1 Tax=Aspergillus pseudoustus TaxID=1810923 RepID=A0ABR4JI89_9EURO
MAIETAELNASQDDHPPCRFPCLGAEQSEDACRLEEVEVPIVCGFLQELCVRYQTTIDLVLGAAWAIILHQYTEDDSVGFSVIYPLTEKETQTKYAYSTSINRETPIGELMQSSAWRRSTYTRTIHSFNTSIVIEDEQRTRTVFESNVVEKTIIASLMVQHCKQTPSLSLLFSRRYLPHTFGKALASSLEQCFRQLMSFGHARVGDIDLFSPLQQEIVAQWLEVPPMPNGPNFLFETLSHHVKDGPSAVALDAWDGQWSYKDLDASSSRLAAHLQAQGVGPGVFVPICFDKSCWAVIAMLAINKAGAAFVALDPSYPAERRQRIIEKVNVALILTSQQHVDLFPPALNLIPLLVSASTLANLSDMTYQRPTDTTAPAYVLFTSGSTGEPKGCAVSHKAFASLGAQTDALRLSPESRTLQFASYSFGMSIIEIFCTLVVGGTVCMPSPEQRLNSLAQSMTTLKVNWAVLTPTVLASLKPEDLPHLRFLLLGGEPMSESQVQQWTGAVDIRYGYGLTEWTGTLSVSDRITAASSQQQQPTIGRPINAHAWLVNPANPDQLVPLGAPGELVIKGPCLAQGYLNEPEITKRSFLAGLSWMAGWMVPPGALYRTGDIMRYCEDGSLVYLYRKDNQIKIRGLRIELGDIESHITRILSGGERVPVVVCRPKGSPEIQVLTALVLFAASPERQPLALGGRNGKELAFVKLSAQGREELRQAQKTLRARLPEYMIPQFLLPLTALPTTASGKIDRRRIGSLLNEFTLHELKELAGVQVEHQLPVNDNERLIQQMTCELLGLTSASMQDSFFDLGGDSVAAMKMAGLARHHNLKLTVKDIFEAPVLAALATRLALAEELTSQQARLKQDQIIDAYPCSPLQEGLCALSMKDPKSYKARVVCRLRPGTDPEAFRAAWERTFQVNDILRTRFVAIPTHGTLQAVVQEQFQWDDPDDLEAYLKAIDQERMGLGDKLVRACLVQDTTCAETQFIFVLTLHHGLCDRWSTRELLEQINRQVTAYPKLLTLDRVPFWPLIQHITQITSHFSKYWIKEMQGIEALVFPELPVPGYSPVADQVFDNKIHLPARVLRDITIASHIRLAWALVIAGNTSLDDVVFGATVNGRGSQVKGIETLTGPTIATVPIRIVLDREGTVLDNLTSIQRQSIEMLPWEPAGLQNIQKYSPEAALACLFQTHLTIQPAWGSHPSVFSDCQEGAAVSGGFASYALNIEFYLADDESQLLAKVAFDPRVISRDRTQRLLDQVQVVLNEIIVQPEQKLSSIGHISPSDMAQLTARNKTVPATTTELVHQVIQAHARSIPQAPAVSSFDGELTFEELDRYASHVAAELLVRRAGPGMLLPVLFEKSRWVLVTMLAVLKTGSTIVPLDSSYSVERIRAICTQVEAPFIICSDRMARVVQDIGLDSVVVAPSSKFLMPSTAHDTPLPVFAVGSDSPLYMIFTSGSTGEPKGLLVNHGAFCASARSYTPELRLNQTSRVLQFCSFAFDICFLEIFATLLAGGCICVPSEMERMNDIHHAMRERQVSHAIITPTYARVIRAEQVPSLRVVMLAGEALLASDVEYWAPRVRLLNGYGPAECSPLSAVQHNDGNPALHPRDIGWPQGCVAWVTDPRDYNILKPIGATGELIIEGPNVGLGYFKNPAETATAFVQPRWLQSLRGGAACRAYRTGDLVCYTDDGRLRYMGRMGQQVKLRGQRLDPSHVEYQLLQCFQGATEVAAVVASPCDPEARPTLAAFILLANGEQGTQRTNGNSICALPNDVFRHRTAAARSKLHEILPAYMVPSLMIPILSMPRTASGKRDRRALTREITQRTRTQLSEYEAAAGEETTKRAPLDNERELQGIWARVLGLPAEAIGLDQSFLALGGDSITAMLVAAQARARQVGLNLKVEDIFRYRTIANIVSQVTTNAAADQQVLVCEDVLDTPFSLSPVQRLFFRANSQHGHNQFNHTLLLHVDRQISYDQLKSAMQDLVVAHPMLRARFVRTSGDEGGWKQLIPTAVEGSFRSSWQYKRRMSSTLADSRQSLDISAGPVLAGYLIESNQGRQSILLAAHHLVVDLVSWTVILNDLEKLLRGGPISGRPSTSFQTWCRLLDQHHQGLVAKSDIMPEPQPWEGLERFWRFSNDSNTYGNSHDTTIQIDRATTDILLGNANKAFGTQPVELLHAALLFAFIRAFPDRPPPTTYSEGHGREPWDATIDLTRTIGWFTTMAPIQVAVDTATELSALVGQVKEARRRLSRNGLDVFTARQSCSGPMEIVFNYGGRYIQQLVPPGSMFRVESLQTLSIFDAAAEVRRWSVVDINSIVQNDGTLTFTFTHPRGERQSQIIAAWGAMLLKTLNILATDFTSSAARVYTPMDFPLLDVNQAQLENVLSSISRVNIQAGIENIYPCAPMQRGILLSQARNPSFYHIAMVWEIPRGAASVTRTQAAVEQIISSHAILRTLFVKSSSETAVYDQVVMSKAWCPVEVVQIGQRGDLASFNMQRPRLTPECPSRFTIYASQNHKVYIRLDITHALVDAQSLNIIQRDLSLALEGRPTRSNSSEYANYIAYLRKVNTENDRRFWETELQGAKPCLFPSLTEHQPSEPDHNLSCTVNLEHVEELYSYCRSHNVTPANVFCLAWSLVLRAYVGSDDVCFGLLASGRELDFDGASDLVGPLINMLTIRLVLGGDSTVGHLLAQAHTDYLRYLRHQTYPIAEISHHREDALQFNTALSIQRILTPEKASSSMRLRVVHREDPAEYAIAVNIDVEPTRIIVNLRHWLSALSREQASLLSSAFGRAVQQIIANDHLPPSQLDLVSTQHKHLIHQWNGEIPTFPEAPVHEIIKQRTDETPDAVAVRWSMGLFTYRELQALSDRLVTHLTQRGVGPGGLVPLCFEKSPWTVVAVLAVIKSGAGFVLFDVTHPDSRLHGICEDLQSTVILCSRSQNDRCKKIAKTVVVVGADETSWPIGSRSDSQPKRASIVTRSPLFVVYTSGSTGKPKGMVIEHRSFCACVHQQISIWGMHRSARVMQFASYAFDASVFEMLFPLMAGATTCILSEVERRDYLEPTMKHLRVTHGFLTPSVARQISPPAVPELELLVIGGEVLTNNDIIQWNGHIRLVQAYGPAECTVFATDHPSLTTSSRPSDIGRPVGCVVWLVDQRDTKRLVPIGGLGEVLIEGPIVSRGYINNPQATEAAFIAPPEWLRALRPDLDNRTRLYKTGDLARYYPDGRIDFHGRKDSQIKIRGQRIELGEVEAQVQACFQAAKGVVVEVAYTSPKNNPALFAFICLDRHISSASVDNDATVLVPADEDFQAQAGSASTTLFERLPAYMVPSYFLPLATLPMNSSGKADRKYLRSLVDMPAEQLSQYRPFGKRTRRLPSTAEERVLHAIWCSTLGLDANFIGVDDNFFQLGGDSVSAMKVAAMARKQGLDISVADIFAHPKLSALVTTAAQAQAAPFELFTPRPFSLCPPDAKDLLPLLLHARNSLPPNTGITDILPVSAGQRFFLKRPTLHHFTFDIHGHVIVDRIRHAAETVYLFFDILRTIFIQWRGQILQLILNNLPVPFHHIVTDSDLAQANQELRDVDRISASLLDDQPPCSFVLISHRTGTQHSFIFRLSHAQWDGLSLGELFSAFSNAYHNRPLQSTTPLTTVVYHRLLRDKTKSLAFWREYLKGSTMSSLIPQLPESTDLKFEPGGTTIWENTTLDPAPEAPPGITMATVVKAAWALIIAAETGSRDIVFGQTVNGRSAALPDIDRVFGCCLNFTPVRIRLEEGEGDDVRSLSDLLRYTQAQYQATVAHDDIGFQTVVEECTDWPAATYINSIVQHQNIPLHHVMPLDDGLQTEFTLHGHFRPGREVVIFTEPAGSVLSVQLCANPNVIGLVDAQRLHQRLVELIKQLCEGWDEQVDTFLEV